MKSFKKSIKFKILIPFSLLFLATIGAMSIVSYLTARHRLQIGVFEKLQAVSNLKKYQIQDWIDSQAEDVFIVANNLFKVRTYSERVLLDKNLGVPPKNRASNCNELAKEFRGISQAKQSLKYLSLLTITGEIICSNNQSLIGLYQPLIGSGTFIAPKNRNQINSTIYYSPLTNQLTMTLYTPFFDSQNFQIGFISVDLDLKRLDSLINDSASLGRESNVILIAQNSNLLEARNEVFTNSLSSIKSASYLTSTAINKALMKESGQGLYLNHQGIPVLGVYDFLENNHLILITEISQDQAFFPAIRLARAILLIGLFFSGIALVFVYFLSEKIAQPIREITQVAIALCQGDLDVKAKVKTEDEVGILGKSLNTMSAHLQETFQELTNQKQTAEKAQQEAENANRAKSTFLANMSHELRTPLNAILGYSEFLEEELTDLGEEDLNKDLQKIQTAGKNLLDIVNNILDISKLETGEIDLNIETFPIIPFIEEIVATSKLLVSQNNNQLKVEYSPDIGNMYGDLTKVRQCLLNLLSNAAKFTKEGIIIFEIKRENFEDQDWIYFQIKDTGIGIAPEQQNQLFSAFNQVDSSATRKFDGAGLGLAIAKQYCQIMGGNITLESELKKGSTFCLKLPAQVKNPETQ